MVASADSGTGTYRSSATTTTGARRPSLDEVNVAYQEEEGARVIALTSGQTDVIDTITPESAASLKSNADIEVLETTGTRLIHLFYNFRKPAGHPLANPRCARRSRTRSTTTRSSSSLMDGQVTSAEGVVPMTLAGFAKTGEYTFDPAKAKSMLAAEGVSGLKVTSSGRTPSSPAPRGCMEAVVAMLAAVGVTPELKQIPKGGDINAWRRGEAGDWDVLGNGYGNQTGLALTNLQGQYGGTAEKEKTRDTYHGFVFPEITALLDQAAAEPDEASPQRPAQGGAGEDLGAVAGDVGLDARTTCWPSASGSPT